MIILSLVHWNYGFLMDWQNTKAGEGFEFHLLAIAASLGIVIEGGCGPSTVSSVSLITNKPNAGEKSISGDLIRH